ncbi:hypothetical protein C440_06072 [Haloferax mucosum ATCC BAA-1512]|uniref:Uncharacterized protein n=1 Tax=Haloferax mucosum ATCC BAA-1512 TaxID=662479 RepID=M0IIZ0_9EURY|nr:hypothetical protein [Haloferax mucosum]ELZ95833.1 hypothetical protein C440_06072 [Haloferax mucosum ATCC BAA-1512]
MIALCIVFFTVVGFTDGGWGPLEGVGFAVVAGGWGLVRITEDYLTTVQEGLVLAAYASGCLGVVALIEGGAVDIELVALFIGCLVAIAGFLYWDV